MPEAAIRLRNPGNPVLYSPTASQSFPEAILTNRAPTVQPLLYVQILLLVPIRVFWATAPALCHLPGYRGCWRPEFRKGVLMRSQMTVGKKISLICAVLVAFTIATGTVALISMSRMETATRAITIDALPGVYLIDRVEGTAKD